MSLTYMAVVRCHPSRNRPRFLSMADSVLSKDTSRHSYNIRPIFCRDWTPPPHGSPGRSMNACNRQVRLPTRNICQSSMRCHGQWHCACQARRRSLPGKVTAAGEMFRPRGVRKFSQRASKCYIYDRASRLTSCCCEPTQVTVLPCLACERRVRLHASRSTSAKQPCVRCLSRQGGDVVDPWRS